MKLAKDGTRRRRGEGGKRKAEEKRKRTHPRRGNHESLSREKVDCEGSTHIFERTKWTQVNKGREATNPPASV